MDALYVGETLWDDFDAYLFDVDGTLIQCTDAVHYFAFCDALKTISGRSLNLEGVTAHGNTDVGILRDALQLAGVADDAWRPRLSGICSAMCSFVKARENELCTTVLPSVREVLGHLKLRGATLGLATGNLKGIGQAKLSRAGLLEYFDMGGWSDGFETRTEVFREAMKQLRKMLSSGTRVCVVGDTPADVSAARENELPVVSVATGIYAREELLRYAPDLCLNSLSDLLPDPRATYRHSIRSPQTGARGV